MEKEKTITHDYIYPPHFVELKKKIVRKLHRLKDLGEGTILTTLTGSDTYKIVGVRKQGYHLLNLSTGRVINELGEDVENLYVNLGKNPTLMDVLELIDSGFCCESFTNGISIVNNKLQEEVWWNTEELFLNDQSLETIKVLNTWIS
jgi:hypothetical protein|nr:MAG TPA: hypothetical protein [Caudoviricetes sp.]